MFFPPYLKLNYLTTQKMIKQPIIHIQKKTNTKEKQNKQTTERKLIQKKNMKNNTKKQKEKKTAVKLSFLHDQGITQQVYTFNTMYCLRMTIITIMNFKTNE